MFRENNTRKMLSIFESTKIFKTKELNKLSIHTQKNNNNNTTKTDISGHKVRMGETKCASSCGTNPKQQMTNKICWASMGCSVCFSSFLLIHWTNTNGIAHKNIYANANFCTF